MSRKTDSCRTALQKSGARLEALSPLAVLSRGYAAVSRENVTLTSVKDVRNGDRLKIRFADGAVDAVAEKGANRNG
jgi:exodeoxyribonuclease VII large subunit